MYSVGLALDLGKYPGHGEAMNFFFYGTLLAGNANPVAQAVHRLLGEVGPASVKGILFAHPDPDGWFPVLAPGEGMVHGRLYEALPSFGSAELARMDAYEDCDPADPVASLYLREEMTVSTADGACPAQVYRFNRPLPDGALPIPGGDFSAWLAKTGLPVFTATRSADR